MPKFLLVCLTSQKEMQIPPSIKREEQFSDMKSFYRIDSRCMGDQKMMQTSHLGLSTPKTFIICSLIAMGFFCANYQSRIFSDKTWAIH